MVFYGCIHIMIREGVCLGGMEGKVGLMHVVKWCAKTVEA